jgi:hypothetical protein
MGSIRITNPTMQEVRAAPKVFEVVTRRVYNERPNSLTIYSEPARGARRAAPTLGVG